MIRRLFPPRATLGVALLLALFVALLYYPLLFTNRVLASGDILLYFYPYRDYAAAMLRQGEIPLWNPYLFMGVPFLANPQAAVLYPLHWPLSWLPVTQQIYWSAALHTWLLGFGLYRLLRCYGLSLGASLVGALVLAGCGFYGGLLGHINQMNAAAWLPWSLLVFAHSNDKQVTTWHTDWQRLTTQAAWFALLVALMVLAGHTQSAYINLFGLGLWLVWAALWSLPTWRLSLTTGRALGAALLPTLSVYGAGVLLGALLCAAQLLPTIELNGLGLREGGLSYGEATSFSLRPWRLPWSLLPTYGLLDLGPIFGVGYTEFVGYVGGIGGLLALIGLWRGRALPRQRGCFWVALGLFLALGRWNPLYYLFYQLVPGFDLFRVPARWLMLYSMGMAVLAGVGTDWLLARWRQRFPHASKLRMGLATGLLLALAIDLLLAAQALPHRQPTAPQAVYEVRTAPAHLLTDSIRARLGPAAMGRFLGMSTITYDPGDLADWRRILVERLPPQLDERTFTDFIIGLKIQELVVPNLPLFWRIPAVDGFDGGVLPLQRYNQFLTLLVPPTELVPDGRLREQIKQLPNADLLGLLNGQYVITDKVRDRWFEGVFYDRQIGAQLTATQPTAVVEVPRSFAATHIDLIGYVAGDTQSLAGTQTPVLRVTAQTAQADRATLLVNAGDQPGAALADPALDSPMAQASGAVVAFQDVEQAHQEYRVRLPLPTSLTPTAITLERLEAGVTVVIQAVTLYDERSTMFVPLLPSDRGHFRLAHSGDVKIYENLDVRPRAYLVHTVHTAADSAAAVEQVRADPAIQAGQAAVIEGDWALQTPSMTAATDRAELTHYAAETVVIQSQSQAEALLVLSDTYYPGWQATVDGVPAPIYATNGLFRGVRVPAGEHEVRFVYQPASWWWGVRLSGMGVILWLILIGSGYITRKALPPV
ncbi:MAG: YfhO family protein [Caldilineaceae bacterium]|nr:YfhO family protein [Caldilineaceae bacterium]